MALLLLRHAIAMAIVTIHTNEDASMFFTAYACISMPTLRYKAYETF